MSSQKSDNQDATVLRLQDLRKCYNVGLPTEVEVLHGLNMALSAHDFCALVGPSGSGKSTLLNLIGLLDQPTDGELLITDIATSELDDEARTLLRRENIGFVFQFHHLIEAFSAQENVLMPLMVKAGKPSAEQQQWAEQLLEAVGLKGFERKKPSELSGGQQQRVAIARALVTRPALLLADEPTGNLDTQTAAHIFELLRRFNREFDCAVLIVTHDPRLSQTCDRTITLVDGHFTEDIRHDNDHSAGTAQDSE